MLFYFACEAAGASSARHSLRPLMFQMVNRLAKLARIAQRDRGGVAAKGAAGSPRPACGERSETARSKSLRVRGTIRKCEPVESPPSPARKMLATSPRKRGEVKNGDAEPWSGLLRLRSQ